MADFEASATASQRLIDCLAGELGWIRAAARAPETRDVFPADAVGRLREIGILSAPLPTAQGGLGWGTEAAQSDLLCRALMLIGHASLVLGRIVEAHVNALQLVGRDGSQSLRNAAWDDVRRGHLFALWVAPSSNFARLSRANGAWQVRGSKGYGTAAGFASRAVVTATIDGVDAEQMVVVDATQAIITDMPPPMHGMRATRTQPVSFDMLVPDTALLGEPGDYLREPDFSAGAWRTTAVTAGGLQALADETAAQLKSRSRHRDPHQSARVGHLYIRARSAALWARAAAGRVADPAAPARDIIAFVGLARVAVEHACLESIPLVQRSLGIGSVSTENPAEALIRDLDTYLRQPAADEVLTEAAVHFTETGVSAYGTNA